MGQAPVVAEPEIALDLSTLNVKEPECEIEDHWTGSKDHHGPAEWIIAAHCECGFEDRYRVCDRFAKAVRSLRDAYCYACGGHGPARDYFTVKGRI